MGGHKPLTNPIVVLELPIQICLDQELLCCFYFVPWLSLENGFGHEIYQATCNTRALNQTVGHAHLSEFFTATWA